DLGPMTRDGPPFEIAFGRVRRAHRQSADRPEQVHRGCAVRKFGDVERGRALYGRYHQRSAVAAWHESRHHAAGSCASVRPRSRAVFLELRGGSAGAGAGCGRVLHRRHPGAAPPDTAYGLVAELHHPRGRDGVRGNVMGDRAARISRAQGHAWLFPGVPGKQGSDHFHRAVGRQRRVAGFADRVHRHLWRQRAARAADGWRGVGLIALVLATAALLLSRESKGLLLGEPAHPRVGETILAIARKDSGVRSANGVLTMQMGPHQVVAMLSAEFEDALTTPEVEACVNRMERSAREADSSIVALFVKPQTEETWRARRKALEEEGNAALS